MIFRFLPRIVFVFLISFNILNTMYAVADSVSISAIVEESCGNNTIEGIEQCDGIDLGGATCVSQGYSGGSLACSASCIFDVSSCSVISGDGGNHYGSYPPSLYTGVIFSGTSLPGAKIYILKDGQLISTVMANSQGQFSSTIYGLSRGDFVFSVYGEFNGVRSLLKSFPLYINWRTTTYIDDINIREYDLTFNTTYFLIPDVNRDYHVDYFDFLITQYWFGKKPHPSIMDFNDDGVVDLKEFSIMAYYWTG